MKCRARVLASCLGVLGLAAAPLACFSSTATPPGEPDSGPLPQEDGASPGDAAGMPTGDGGHPPAESGATDAVGPTDAGADATLVDASPQPLTLTVLLLGVPEPGVNVVFQDGTGAVIATATTDATGRVTRSVMAGSQVTALLGTLLAPQVVTIQGVAPGDALTVVDPATSASSPSEPVTVTLPAATWDSSATAEGVYAGSCYNPLPYPINLTQSCESAGEFPLLARAFDTGSGQEIAYTYQLGNAAQPDGGLPDGATSLPIVMTLPWATSTATATITATNPPGLPADGGGFANGVTLDYDEIARGVVLRVPAASVGTTDDAGAQSAGFVMHPGYPDFVQAEAVDQFTTPQGLLVAGGATRAAAQATSLAMSFDLSTLPLITATSVDTADGGATSQPVVTWTSTASLAAANGIYISAQWSSSITTDASTLYVNGTWTILAPPTATNVHAPALPASLAAWGPSPTASFNPTPRVAAVQASFAPGYAGFRALFGGVSLLSGWQIELPALPVNGTVYLVGLYPNEG